ncbi:MAG: ATP-binding protein, partial [Rhodobacteraceae bacterium]|nr:ATP-binding protein [Paracoccaceae bacterium]
MAQKTKIEDEFVHLARVALSERTQDVHMLLHRIARRRTTDKKLAESLIELLRKNPTRSTPLRRDISTAVPTDSDTRFHLLRVEETPRIPFEPVYSERVQAALGRLVEERKRIEVLLKAGLEPTRTVLFTGPPGVGKTLGSRWIARNLDCPLMILDLSAVMSSYLGRTGANLRHVLDHAKSCNCVLLLDELDAIAKRRDDAGEIGELKRLVTVLLQQLDDWPSSGLLIAATNHADLLDPAAWRRFEQQVHFDLAEAEGVRVFLEKLLEGTAPKAKKWINILSTALAGRSYGDIEREVTLAKRAAALDGQPLDQH